MTIKAIVAIGNQGQVGLDGRLPWHDPEDLKWFREQTMGKVCIVGWNTAQALPKLPGRKVLTDSLHISPMGMFMFARRNPDAIIIGGPKTYARWNHLVDEWLVSRVNYNGPCDTVFDFSLLDGKTVTYRNGGTVHDHGRSAIREQTPEAETAGGNEAARRDKQNGCKARRTALW